MTASLQFSSSARFKLPFRSLRRSVIRSCLPFPPEKARFHYELVAAVDAVERACRLCIDVKKSLLSSNSSILEKNDQTPVTVADFGVQALISLELGRLFPTIPLVAEEDSGFLRGNAASLDFAEGYSCSSLLDAVLHVVNDNSSISSLSTEEVLDAIDRGGKDAISFDAEPATYWVLDPIDGTRGFLRGCDALYVVGLALVVEGKITLGVMGCPNWKDELSSLGDPSISYSSSGIIMIAHLGCGAWKRELTDSRGSPAVLCKSWLKCFVDSCRVMHEARICIPDSQTWESIPVSAWYNSSYDADTIRDERTILLLAACCGSLCKYLMVASGRASVFIQKAKEHTLIKVWDHAAGILCVHEAEGEVSDWSGDPLDLAADHHERRVIFPSGGVLVTNSSLHKQLLKLISSKSTVL